MRIGVMLGLMVLIARAGDAPSTQALLAQLRGPDAGVRKKAAEALAERRGDEISDAAQKCLKTEKDPEVHLALEYVLAAHGDLDAVRALVASPKYAEPERTIYLRHFTGVDYEDPTLWREWFDDANPREFRHMRERMFLTDQERDAGWPQFKSALSELQKGKSRAKVVGMLGALAAAHPRSDPGYLAQELADRLKAMVAEDAQWKDPAHPGALPVDQRIQYYVHHLRDVTGIAGANKGVCDVLTPKDNLARAPNAADALLNIGKAALPRLLDLLDDERLTRAVAHYGDAHYLKVLRYQDVAMQIINTLQAKPLFGFYSTGQYLSDASPSWRKKIVATLRRWYAEGCKSDEASRLWLLVDLMKLYPSLDTLETLATKYHRKKDVIAKLHKWYDTRHWVYQPHYAALLAELGDRSKVGEVLHWYHEGRYANSNVERPDDSAASMNAQEEARRLAKGLLRMKEEDRWRDTGYGRR